jgi:hypothetical protein
MHISLIFKFKQWESRVRTSTTVSAVATTATKTTACRRAHRSHRRRARDPTTTDTRTRARARARADRRTRGSRPAARPRLSCSTALRVAANTCSTTIVRAALSEPRARLVNTQTQSISRTGLTETTLTARNSPSDPSRTETRPDLRKFMKLLTNNFECN